MSLPELLNRTTAPQILRFFDVCFKQGVLDAADFGDDLGVKEFYDKKVEDWSFGVVNGEQDMEWRAFLFTLYWWARKARMATLADKYFFAIRTKTNHAWCVLPYCMRFYLMGIKEWTEYPNPVNLEVFKSAVKLHWSPKAGVKKFTKGDYFTHLHDFEYAFKQIPMEERPISDVAMQGFVMALFDLTRGF